MRRARGDSERARISEAHETSGGQSLERAIPCSIKMHTVGLGELREHHERSNREEMVVKRALSAGELVRQRSVGPYSIQEDVELPNAPVEERAIIDGNTRGCHRESRPIGMVVPMIGPSGIGCLISDDLVREPTKPDLHALFLARIERRFVADLEVVESVRRQRPFQLIQAGTVDATEQGIVRGPREKTIERGDG